MGRIGRRVEATVINILDAAKNCPKGDYRAYEKCKRLLRELRLEPLQYDVAHRDLMRIIEI